MNEKLQSIREENIIIFIYFILLLVYLYANTVEVEYLKSQNKEDKKKYQLLLYIVFGVSFVISIYYSLENLISLQKHENPEIYYLEVLSTVANILVVVATGIYLYIIYKDEDINLEVSP